MKKIIIAVLGVLVIGVVFFLFKGEPPVLAGTETTELHEFKAGIRLDNSSDAAARPNTSLLNVVATTTVWNPPNIPVGGATSTEFAVSSTFTGFVRGMCGVGGFTLASSSGFGQVLHTDCLYATSTAIISLSVPASSSQAVDIGTSTVTIFQLQF